MKNTSLITAFLSLTVLALTSCQSPKTEPTAPACGPEVRAAFDIGSGSTKMKVAEFNTCDSTLTKILLEDQKRVNYQEALQNSKDETFSQEVQDDGLDNMRELLDKALQQKATKFAGVATAAFRKAKNAPEFLMEVEKKLGIKVKIITQEQEAMIGFAGAAKSTSIPREQILLWDIGGGSQQMVFMNEQGQPEIYYGNLASVSFKNHIIKNIQKKDVKKIETPNPMGEKTAGLAAKFAVKTARTAVPAKIQNHIKKGAITVVGIGGVLSRSITSQVVYQENITGKDLERALAKRVSLDDKKIGGEYPQTEISNLILVDSYMRALGITQYLPVKASLIDGLWYDEAYWH